MTIQAVEREILEPMQRLFLPPRGMDEGAQKAALREYADALGYFDADDLKLAWTTVRDTWIQRGWPTVASFVQAARIARKERRPEPSLSDKEAEAAARKWQTWLDVRSNKLAAKAVEMDVAWALKCAITDDGKQPDEINLGTLRRQKDSAQRLADKIADGTAQFTEDNQRQALELWRVILIRNAETAEEINRAQRHAA